jgi:hypothetical protein
LERRSAIKPIINFGVALDFTAVFAGSGLAAVGGEQARDVNASTQPGTASQTTTPWSPTGSSSNTPSHEANGQLGNNPQGSSLGAPKFSSNTVSDQLGRRRYAKEGQDRGAAAVTTDYDGACWAMID